MNKICTNIEQSKQLIELGIDVNTADMMWDDWRLIDDGWKIFVGYDPEIEQDFGRKCYPAWSLSALMELIQDDIKIEKTLFDQSDMFTYSIIGDGYEYRSHEHECLLDAAFEFVCWILENKNQ